MQTHLEPPIHCRRRRCVAVAIRRRAVVVVTSVAVAIRRHAVVMARDADASRAPYSSSSMQRWSWWSRGVVVVAVDGGGSSDDGGDGTDGSYSHVLSWDVTWGLYILYLICKVISACLV